MCGNEDDSFRHVPPIRPQAALHFAQEISLVLRGRGNIEETAKVRQSAFWFRKKEGGIAEGHRGRPKGCCGDGQAVRLREPLRVRMTFVALTQGRVKGVPPLLHVAFCVGDGQETPARFQDTLDFPDGLRGVWNVVQHVTSRHHVETPVRERKMLGVSLLEVNTRKLRLSLRNHACREIQAYESAVVSTDCQPSQKRARATADIQHIFVALEGKCGVYSGFQFRPDRIPAVCVNAGLEFFAGAVLRLHMPGHGVSVSRIAKASCSFSLKP